ncbi:hypothetical protein ACFO5X_21470 [Seohaeicola nanhaiensis]|uniref:Uncharacterized protein n=1 Tax=Seohaeicola nanhaiensis TaxID=1387282 RepID=A0ABV9KM56_9RHOB
MRLTALTLATALSGAATLSAAERTAASDGADMSTLVSAFMDTCVAAFPNYAEIPRAFAAVGMQAQKDGTWGSHVLHGRVQKSEGRPCGIFAYGLDPVDAGESVLRALAKSGKSVSHASRKGRRTSIEVTINGQPAIIKINPLLTNFVDVSITKR